MRQGAFYCACSMERIRSRLEATVNYTNRNSRYSRIFICYCMLPLDATIISVTRVIVPFWLRRSSWLLMAIVVVASFAPPVVAQRKDHAKQETQAKVYSYAHDAQSADIAPDESVVALERSSRRQASGGKIVFDEVVELWDFRNDKVLASTVLKSVEAERTSTGFIYNPIHASRFVRFAESGATVVVCIGTHFTLLDGKTLKAKSEFEAVPPQTLIMQYESKGKTLSGRHVPHIAALEVSPDGSLVALVWSRDPSYVGIEVYNLVTSQQTMRWETRDAGNAAGMREGLAWDPSSKLVFVATTHPGFSDVLGIDVQSGKLKVAITSGFLAGDVAVAPGPKILVVDHDRPGVTSNHHPKMQVFDLTGKKLQEVSAERTAVRYSVSVAANGSRAAAWTSDVRCAFDWMDMRCFDYVAKAAFTVWALPEFSKVTTIATPLRMSGVLKLSASGRYVLAEQTKVQVFELPN